MFTIIAGVIGLGIAVALLIVGANYLGSAYSNSTAKANATSLANLGQQVQGAVQLAKVEQNTYATFGDLKAGNYIVSPTLPLIGDTAAIDAIVTSGDVVTFPFAAVNSKTEALCAQVVAAGGSPWALTLAAGTRYGCVGGTGNASATGFAYRVN